MFWQFRLGSAGQFFRFPLGWSACVSGQLRVSFAGLGWAVSHTWNSSGVIHLSSVLSFFIILEFVHMAEVTGPV